MTNAYAHLQLQYINKGGEVLPMLEFPGSNPLVKILEGGFKHQHYSTTAGLH